MPDFDMTTTTVDILRHAECEGGPIFRGSTDVALSEAGWARLRRVTGPLEGWDTIVTSPMRRCREFSAELAAARDVPLNVDERFREMYFGDWEGVLIADVWANQSDAARAWYVDPENNTPPNAEPLPSIRARVAEGWTELVAANRGGHVLLVCHGGVIRNLVAHVLDLPLAATNRFGMPYGCRARISITHDGESSMPRLMGYNLDRA
ncbi:histidine phosphatase family protein [Salinisphaera sp. LB1]|uniref:histidine phosphatase family protein n=1 Tax=Salinisphaera sp. LB1 TaxID=2183911 RepID=UPI000D7E8160|nr:histidine phosphatase family protein [Salinisphaera sp. LB1]AWN15455.1 Alpha-ribazole-5'-phosphate phosphatase [Salinisphaera sp. LB1]